MKEQKADNESKQLEKIRECLKPSTTPLEIYDSISEKRVDGTGDWIQEEPLFQAWIERKTPILWLSGGPGAGKSFISSNIIRCLTQLYPQGIQDPRRISVAYFFCKDYDPELRSLNKVLRSLAFQICINDPVYAKYCSSAFSVTGEIRSIGSLWKKLFVDFFRKDILENSVLILIDGLDAAFEDDRKEFLGLLKDFRGQATKGGILRMQLVIVGRPELNWDDILDDQVPMVSVSAEKTSKDIKEYTIVSIAKVKILRRVSRELQQEIVTRLKKRRRRHVSLGGPHD